MMKRRAISLVLALLLAAVPAALLWWGFGLPSQYDSTFLGELKEKCQLLDETEGKRLVIVGGSAAAFGVDCALLEQAFPDYAPVNFGMYAALGTKVMLELSQDSLREGDIVLLMPEQQSQTLSAYLNGAALWQGLDGAFGLLRRIRREDWGTLIGAFPAFAAEKLRAYRSGTPYSGQGVYAKSAFDRYGDIGADCPANTMPGGWDATTPISFAPEVLDEGFVSAVNRYVDALAARGVTVWYHFCPMNALAVEDGADPDAYCDLLREALHCPMAGDPAESILDAGWFYDTNFHLNTSGKQVFTAQLIRDCKAMLGDSSPTDIPLPEQPKPEEKQTALTGEESADTACFQYEETETGWIVTGLTEEGRRRRALTVPETCGGEPVVRIASEAFSDCGELEEIVLPATVQAIGERAFSGCGALEHITLTNADPAACQVGQQLLEGTNALLLVPEEALNDYKLNYTWSQYAQRLRPAD